MTTTTAVGRPNRRGVPHMVAIGSLLLVAACSSTGSGTADGLASSTSGEPPATTAILPASTGDPGTSATNPDTNASTSQSASYESGYWEHFGDIGRATIELEPASSLEQLERMSDLVVVGKIVEVSADGYVEMAPGAPSSRVQFVRYIVESTSKEIGSASFQLAVPVRTDKLDAAVQATITPVDLNGDGKLDDDELSKAINPEAVAAAYSANWDDAVKEVVATLAESLPDNETVFFLRQDENSSNYRPVNGDSIIVNDGGSARIPWRDGDNDPPTLIQLEVEGLMFDDILRAIQ